MPAGGYQEAALASTAHVHMHVHVHVCVCVCVHACRRLSRGRSRFHWCASHGSSAMHSSVSSEQRTCTHACTCTWAGACICMHLQVQMRMHTRMNAHAHVCNIGCARAHVHAHGHVRVSTRLRVAGALEGRAHVVCAHRRPQLQTLHGGLHLPRARTRARARKRTCTGAHAAADTAAPYTRSCQARPVHTCTCTHVHIRAPLARG